MQMASQLMLYFSLVSSVFVLNRFIFVLDFWLIPMDMVLSLKGELNTWVCTNTFWPKRVGRRIPPDISMGRDVCIKWARIHIRVPLRKWDTKIHKKYLEVLRSTEKVRRST